MPDSTIAVPAERFLIYGGVVVFHTYKDDDFDQGRNRFHFTTYRYETEDGGFDVRDLDVPSKNLLNNHPPYLSASSNPDYAKASADQKLQWEKQWAEWHKEGGGEDQAIRILLVEAIDRGLITTGDPDEYAEENPFDNKQAVSEGWDLFEVEGRIQLQRIDCPDLDELGYDEPKFASDADALIFVALQAHAESAYHRDAIERIGTSVY